MIEQIAPIDMAYMLGFFMALALRRGRIDSMIGGMMKWFPNEKNPGIGPREDSNGGEK